MAAGEDIQHLFVHYDFANTLWARLEDVFQVSLHKTSDLKSLLSSALKKKMSKQIFNSWVTRCALYYMANLEAKKFIDL